MPRFTPQSAGEWAAVLPRWIGAAGLTATFVFWMVSGRLESTFVTTFGGLLLGSEAIKAHQESRALPRRRVNKTPPKKQRGQAD